MNRPSSHRNGGFTLLELLIVVVILAALSGVLLVAYEGLEDRAANAHNGYNSAAITRAIATYKRINGEFPNDWDSLLAGNSSLTPFSGSKVDRLPPGLTDRLTAASLTPAEVTALQNVGITTVRDLDTWIFAVNQYDNDFDFKNDDVNLPNRIFDDAQ